MSEHENGPDKKSEETRARIFSVTLDLINEVGTEKLTIRKIAEVAGVSPALIIQYFHSKGELLQQAFELRNEELVQTIRELKDAEFADPFDLLDRFAAVQMDRDMRHPALTLTVLANSFSWDTDSAERVDRRLKSFRDAQREVLDAKFPRLSENYRHYIPLTFFFIYGQALRRLLQTHMTIEQAHEFLAPHFRIVADAMIADTAG